MESERLKSIITDRKKKIEELKKLGVNPYPSKSSRKNLIKEARDMMGKDVCIAGRITAQRGHGKIAFYDLKDESGKIQLLLKEDSLGKKYELTKLLDVGDFLEVTGEVTKTQSGEITVNVSDLKILTKAVRPLPDKWHGLTDVEERYRQRYVDLLMNPEVREIFEKRAKIVRLLRKFLDKKGFLEVKTPALQPIYGGATARPFTTHHNALDFDLYLRIADELYLKRLVVGGIEKVYEIGTDFRNEGIDRWHNPEFSMLEFYWAYATYEDLMIMTEEMLSWIVNEVNGSQKIKYGEQEVDFSTPWKKISLRDAILEKTGIDIEKENTNEKLLKAVKEKKIRIQIPEAPDFSTMIDELYKAAVRPNIINPTFLIDYPYFMRPLAKRKESEPTKVENFQLVAAGAELINAYSELNDPADQKARWEEDVKREKEGVVEHQVIDEDFIRALEYGMPPTAGWGMGIERFTTLLTNKHSLKEVILFPTLKPETQKEIKKA